MRTRFAAKKLAAFLFPMLVLAVTATASASTGVGGGLPWDAPLQTLQEDLTGPVATSISVLGLFAAGAALVFGEELGSFVRRALLLVVAIAFLVLGSNFLTGLGLSGVLL
jgi:type IV secretory pathway VirB2 component (pilin)